MFGLAIILACVFIFTFWVLSDEEEDNVDY